MTRARVFSGYMARARVFSRDIARARVFRRELLYGKGAASNAATKTDLGKELPRPNLPPPDVAKAKDQKPRHEVTFLLSANANR